MGKIRGSKHGYENNNIAAILNVYDVSRKLKWERNVGDVKLV